MGQLLIHATKFLEQAKALTDRRLHRILLIDDNKHGLNARRVLLEDLGYQIDTACCGKEGLTIFENEAFDLVVTDYRMPDLQGGEVIKRIRLLNTKLPIVMLSGYVDKLGLTKDELGADVVLSKGPNEDRDLARTIARLVGKKPAKKSPQSDRRGGSAARGPRRRGAVS